MLETADNVVQPYTLPKPLHVVDHSSSKDFNFQQRQQDKVPDPEKPDDPDIDEHMQEAVVHVVEPRLPGSMPKTMQQLAEANAQRLAIAPPEKAGEYPQIALIETSPNRRTSVMRNDDTKDISVLRARSTRSRKRARSVSSSEETGSVEHLERSRLKAGRTSGPIAQVRTLRPRVPKSDEKKRQERELELAYRRAIEE